MGFIIVFDLTNEQSFLNVRSWLEQLKLHSYCDQPDIVMCGNKVDQEDIRTISWSRANNEANKHGIPYFETSASTGLNVAKAVEALLELVMIRMHKVVELRSQAININGTFGLTPVKYNHDNNTDNSSCYSSC